MKVWHIAAITAAALCLIVGGCSVDGPEYGSGYRDGVVQKFSRKGFVFKSNEGELALSSVAPEAGGGGMSSRWEFTVEDECVSVVRALKALKPGETVRLHYEQRMWASYRYSTRYRVIRVERLKKGAK